MNKRKVALTLLSVLVVMVLIWYFQDSLLTDGYAASIFPDFVPPAENEAQILILKNADPTGKILLIKTSPRLQFLAYDSSSKSINATDQKTWKRSQEQELDCWDQSTPDDYGGRSYGHYILNAKYSPDNNRIAVLSAYGPSLPGSSLHPGLGGADKIWGTRYLEIKETSGLLTVGRPIRIDISSKISKPSLCWSEGARYVVVYFPGKDFGATVSVAETPTN
jgi:hypothetical protein